MRVCTCAVCAGAVCACAWCVAVCACAWCVVCVWVLCVRVRGVLCAACVRVCVRVCVCAFFSFEFQQRSNDFDQHTSPRLHVIDN
jgi:hypothetical protein